MPSKCRIFGLGGQDVVHEHRESLVGGVTRISRERQVTALQQQLAIVVKYLKPTCRRMVQLA